MLAGIDFLDQVLLRDHFAGNLMSIGIVDCQVSLCKTALPKHFVLYKVFPIHNLDSLQVLSLRLLFFLLTGVKHFTKQICYIGACPIIAK